MKIYKHDGTYRIHLPFRFAIGVGPTCRGDIPWSDWSRYVWFERYFHGSWHVRFLWFYLGRMSVEGKSILKRHGKA